MKIILIQPPIQDFYDTDIRLQPVGLCSLKAVIKKYHPDVEVKVMDFHHGWKRRTVKIPKELSYLHSYYRLPNQSPFSGFDSYYHFGADFETIAESVTTEKPDLVGISALFSPYYQQVITCAEAIKKRCQVNILLGGGQVTAMPELMLKQNCVDYIIIGEGEAPIISFVSFLKGEISVSEVPNLGYKQSSQLVINPIGENLAIDEIPPPDYTDLPVEEYLYRGKPLRFVVTSRGCPYFCSFCSVHQTFGHHRRTRSSDQILEEIRSSYNQGIRVIDFEDDNLSCCKNTFVELLEKIIKDFPNNEIELLAMNGLAYWKLNEHLLGLMHRAGFRSLDLSLVSSNPQTLAKLYRPYQLGRFQEVIQKGHKLGFAITVYLIIGLPQEELGSMINSLAFLARLPVKIGCSIFYLSPGCPIASNFPPLDQAGLLQSRSTALATINQQLSRDDLYTLFISTRIINFIKELKTDQPTVELNEILNTQNPSDTPRTILGKHLLCRLINENKLFAHHKGKETEISHFKADLFQRLLFKTSNIRNTLGRIITV